MVGVERIHPSDAHKATAYNNCGPLEETIHALRMVDQNFEANCREIDTSPALDALHAIDLLEGKLNAVGRGSWSW